MMKMNDRNVPPPTHAIATGCNTSMYDTSGISIVRDNVTMMMFSKTMKIYPTIISTLGFLVGRTVSEE
jgi:hypothetical protein